MDIRRLTEADDPLYIQAMALYAISFPVHEQRETFSQLKILRQDAYHFDVICDHGTFIGEILYWDYGGMLYIEHFCVHPKKRNRHYGQKILKAYETKPLILEIDPPVDQISIRRKHFYERCDFVENPYPHVHPAYHVGNSGHELVVMSSPETLTSAQYEQFQRFLQDIVMKDASQLRPL